MALSEMAVRNAKPRERDYKLFDGGGLHLLVRTNGSRLWRLAYRHQGSPRQLAFGPYPVVSLANARQQRDDAKRVLRAGQDPSLLRRQERDLAAVAARNTFGEVAKDFIQKMSNENQSAKTVAKYRWMLEDLSAPLTLRPITQITAAEILVVLQKIEKSGRRETARRMRSTISRVFRFGVATLRASADPTHLLQGALAAPAVKSRAAVTNPKEVGGLLRAIDGYEGWLPLRTLLQFLALTFVRPGEARLAEWKEIDFKKAVWSIPPERMKMRRPHDVPLSRQAVEVLHKVHSFSGESKFVFPSVRVKDRVLSDNTCNAALRRMGFEQNEMTAHGFRAMASTNLHERGYVHDVIETQLAHLVGSDVSRAYNRALYWPQRVELMQAWADMLDEFRTSSVNR